MDCRSVVFSADKSQQRIRRALLVFPHKLLMRIMAFALYLQGAKRKDVAALVAMPDESVKTLLYVVMRDAFPALRDRRCSATSIAHPLPSPSPLSVHRNHEGWNIEFGGGGQSLNIPASHPIQARTVILSLLNAEAISVRECALALDISVQHCHQLKHKLADNDVAEALIDKRQGQQQDYRVGSEQKAEIIHQLVARTVIGLSTSSRVLAAQVSQRTRSTLSDRTIRWHINKLGLSNIRKTLPQLIETLKKTPEDRC